MSDTRTLGVKMDNTLYLELVALCKEHDINKSELMREYVKHVVSELKQVDDTTEGILILLKILELDTPPHSRTNPRPKL